MSTRYCFPLVILTCLGLISAGTAQAQTIYGSAQHTDVGNPAGLNTDGDATTTSWTDIMLGPQSANVWSPVEAIPFAFEFFGTAVTHFKASQNGLVTFDTAATALPDDNTNLPSGSLPDMTIACYWDHFTSSPPTGTGDDITVKVFGTAPNRQFWIKWYSFEYGTVAFSYFAVVLEETTNKIYLVDQYNSTSPLLTTTAGIQLDNTTAFQFGDSTLVQGGNGSANTDNDYIEFFILSPVDAGVAVIDSPATPACGNPDLWVTIQNFGTMTLDSAEVHWTVNGVPQTTYNWTGPLAPGASTGPVQIGPYAFADGDLIVAWTENPNGGSDGNAANDTASTTVGFGFPGGTYTIGGATPDFADFSSAAAVLNAQGICGPVVFNVAAGTYNEQLELLEIAGTNSTNTITFNCAGATIHFAPTVSDARHIVRLNGADFVTFNDLVIQVDAGATYGWGVQLSNASDNNSLVGCTINGDTTSTSSVNFVGIAATASNTTPATSGDNASNLTIDGCSVVGGYYGIRLNGSTTSGSGNTVTNSTIQNTYLYNVYLNGQAGALVSGNDISRPNRTTISTFYGVYVTGSSNCTVEKNVIHNTHASSPTSTAAGYGIYFSAADAPAGQENVAKNNLLYDFNGNGLAYAVYNSSSDGAYYYNNTISLDNTAATAGATRGFYQVTQAANIDFRNNIITITRGGSGIKHGLYFSTATSTIVSNNNAIYLNSAGSGAQHFGNFGGTDYTTYNDWRTANGGIYDSLSVNADPLYTDVLNNNFIPTSGVVNDIGVPLAEVTEDILGTPRPSTPDPGAYEFSPAAVDAGIAAIDSPATPSCNNPDLWVTIQNYGSGTLSSVDVHWTVNGLAQPVYNWTGSIPGGGSLGPVQIGPFTFADGDAIVAWTENPNGGSDGNPANDTASATVHFGIAGGTYTIGGVSPDYVDFSAAASALNTNGICGPVVFNVAAGMYNEQLELMEIAGANSTNTVTFNCAGATIHFAPAVTDARHIVRLNGADYVTLNDLTIRVDSGATYGWGVQLSNAANNNSLFNCTINGDVTSTSSLNFAGIVATGSHTSPSTAGDNANDLTIDGCTVIGGYYGIRLNGNATSGNNNAVTNSTIQDTYIYNIYLDDQMDALISGNDISRPNRTGVSTFYGVYLISGNEGVTIEKNRIHNTHGSASSLTGASYALYFTGADAPAGQENVAKNNLIYNFNSNGTAYAVYNSSSNGAYYYNNTISLDHITATGGETRGFYQITLADNIDFRNNIITITRGGSGIKHGLYFSTSTSTIISNNNAIFLNSAGSGAQHFGNFGGTNFTTYIDWRTANGGIYDSASVNADPVYTSLAGENFRPTSGLVNDIGASLAEVTDDFDGNPRPGTPDAGAYEFTPSAIDAGVSQFLNLPVAPLPGSVQTFDIEVANFGTDPIPADTVDVYVNSVFSSSVGYSSLAGGQRDTVSTSYMTTTSADAIMAAVRPVTGDGNPGNDTLTTSVPVATVYAAPYSQDFESGSVGTPGTLPVDWTNEGGDDFEWYVDAGGTPSSGTGPAVDHTLGTSVGKYMFTESSSPNSPAKVANLTSPYIDLAGKVNPAMEFWFHMFGATMGELHVDVWSSGSWTNDVRSPLVGQYQTADTAAWLRAGVELGAYAGQVIKVRFRGITGSSFTSDMAIDDVTINEIDSLGFPYEIQAQRVETPLLTKMPLTQTGIVSAIDFSGTFSNVGPSDNGDLNVEVVNSSTVFTNSITGATVPAFSDSTFALGQWNASSTAADMYNVRMYSSNFTGPNDTATALLELGERIGYDNGVHTNSITHTSTSRNLIGARFTLTDPDTLTSVTMMITSSTVLPDSFAIDLYTSVNDTPGTATARLFRGTFGDVAPLPALVTIFVISGLAMPAGDFFAILDMDTPSAASFPMGADNTGLGSIRIPRRFVLKSATSDWLYFEDAGNTVFRTFIPIVRVGFQESAEVHDYAVISIDADDACFVAGNVHNIYARIDNRGNQAETGVTVELRDNGVTVDNVLVSLQPGVDSTVTFSYTPGTAGVRTLTAVALLTNDINSANDSSSFDVRVMPSGTNIVFQDNFSDTTFTSANWTVTNDGGNGVWLVYPIPYPNLYTLPSTSVGNVFSADADATGSGTTTLTTAYLSVDVSSYTSVMLDFDSDWRHLDAQDTARVKVSSDGGTTWTTVFEVAGVSQRDTHYTFNLSSQLAGSATAVIAFQSIQPGFDWWWTIDNVCVTGSSGGGTVTIGVPVAQNWNIVSLPVSDPVPDDSVKHIYVNSSNPYAFAFVGGYVQRYVMEPGPGYWVKSTTAYTQNITGTARDTLSIPVANNWNMIGSISTGIDTSAAHVTPTPANLRASNFFRYSNGYVIAATIDPGSGYWVKANGAGSFFMHVTGPAGMASGEGVVAGRSIEDLNTLTIQDASGGSQTLYFGSDGNNEIPVAMFAMPPAPPVGSFDARFESSEGGLMVQTHADEVNTMIDFPITVQSSAPTGSGLTVSWKVHPVNGVNGTTASYELSDGVVSHAVRGEGTLKITNSEASHLVLKVTGSGLLPEEFALMQNYPNPFNPTTNIRFALPVESRVTVEIYNVLGQRVKTLISEQRAAGFHTVEWNGTGNGGQLLGSGIYFLQMSATGANAEQFNQTRKLMMVK